MEVITDTLTDIDVMRWLREETRLPHARLERHPRLAALLAPGVTPEAYRDVLVRTLGFCAPLEVRLSRAFAADVPAARAPLIARDLRALGVSLGALAGLPVCAGLPDVDGAAAALGVRYVLESVPLGGGVTLKHVARTLGVTPARGAAFYGNADTDAPMRARALGRAVRTFVARGGSPGDVSAAATEAFVVLDVWLGL